MSWVVLFCDEFLPEFKELDSAVQVEMLAMSKLLVQFGPELGRPSVDTLNGSRHSNMKELRFKVANGVWRVAFAFDPNREAILLVAGNKSGINGKRFYKTLINKADKRFDDHISRQAAG